ncbi:kinase-like protein [Westerdykella ornata]|uniref:Kinase-like protein n=1 Tax=Westerdykella ornata TaxID=318751 RepID=A0A6A6JZC9_WESOR|nr:kinase-like protein [Westerdykella ornata]KAF2281565.1 kinase-like protein [Westerdykella ornata]
MRFADTRELIMLSRLRLRSNVFRRPSYNIIPRWLRGRSSHSASTSEISSRQGLMSSSTVKTFENVSEDDLFTYKAQRWLWNEAEQLQRRYLKCEMTALIEALQNAAGPGATCKELTKFSEGNFNKAFLATMDDGRQLVARLPNPNAGRSHYTTASEVATMDYVRDRLDIPVPKVLTYNTSEGTNGVGAEYLIMEKCPGIELSHVWDSLSGKERVDIVKQLVAFTSRLYTARFPCYGSLYYSRDIPRGSGIELDDTFSVGPTTSRSWFDDRRGEVDIDRGPWKTAEDVMKALIKREMACLETFPEFPRDRQQGIFNGPGGFHPSKALKLSVLNDCSRVLPYIMPKEDAFTATVLWHNDLHSDNIFVNADRPTEITGIIDWQGVHLHPAFLHVHYPSLVEYDGPVLPPLSSPQLPPNIKEMEPVEKEQAKALFLAQPFYSLYQINIKRQTPELLLFDDGEVYVQSLLAQLTEPDTWSKVGGSVSCPLAYTDEERSRQNEELAKWQRDVERKARVIEDVGAYTGWDGAVAHDEYDVVAERLQKAKEKFLDAEAGSPEERAQWIKAWPFQDR